MRALSKLAETGKIRIEEQETYRIKPKSTIAVPVFQRLQDVSDITYREYLNDADFKIWAECLRNSSQLNKTRINTLNVTCMTMFRR